MDAERKHAKKKPLVSHNINLSKTTQAHTCTIGKQSAQHICLMTYFLCSFSSHDRWSKRRFFPRIRNSSTGSSIQIGIPFLLGMVTYFGTVIKIGVVILVIFFFVNVHKLVIERNSIIYRMYNDVCVIGRR